MVEGVGFGVEKLGFKAWAVESSGVLVYTAVGASNPPNRLAKPG